MLLRAVGLAVFAIGVLSPLFLVTTGIECCDEPYQILVAQNYLEAPMSFFSGFLSSIWGNAFGFGVLAMRYHAVTCQLLALLACSAYLYSKIRKPWICLLTTGICSFILNGVVFFRMAGWDATSTLFIALTAVVLFLYIDNPLKITWLILAGILTTCAAFSRIPNVVIAPIVVAIILAYQPNGLTLKQRISNATIYVLTIAILSAILICSAYGSFGAYLHKITENAIADHSLMQIVASYINNYLNLLFDIALLCFIYVVIRYIHQVKLSKSVVALLLLLGVLFFSIDVKSGNFALWYFNLAFFISLIALFFLKNRQQAPSHRIAQFLTSPIRVKLCIVGIFVFIPVVGSNMGIIKTIPFTLFPLLLSIIWPQLNKTTLTFITVIATTLVIIVAATHYQSFFSASGAQNISTSPNVAKLKGVHTTIENANMLENIDSLLNANKDANIIFLSNTTQRFMGYYLQGRKPTYHLHDWNLQPLDDTKFVEATTYAILNNNHSHTIVMFIDYDPKDMQTLMVDKLQQLHPTQIEEFPSLKLFHFQSYIVR